MEIIEAIQASVYLIRQFLNIQKVNSINNMQLGMYQVLNIYSVDKDSKDYIWKI